MALDPMRWANLWTAIAPGAAAGPLFEELSGRYAEPHRHYHTGDHVAACLALFDGIRGRVRDPVSLELAIWYHDVIYEPRAHDNEVQSARIATAVMQRAGVSQPCIAQVVGLILATANHDPVEVVDSAWMLDIDLAVLGSKAEVFAAYDAGIQAEYAWVEPAEYRSRRAAVLAGFLARPRIYQTDLFFERFETRARLNLQHWLSAA